MAACKTLDEANAKIQQLEQALQHKRETIAKEESNLSRTLGVVQHLAEQNVRGEDKWREEEAFLAGKVEDLERHVRFNIKCCALIGLMVNAKYLSIIGRFQR